MTNHTTLNRTLGERMEKARKVSKLTQKEIAARLGVGVRSLIRYEADDKRPSHALLIAWASVTDVPLAWLETGEESADTATDTGRYPTTADALRQVSASLADAA